MNLFERRNQAVRVYFDKLAKKNPQWRLDALEDDAAEQFFLKPRTIRAILKGEGIYAPVSKESQLVA